MKPDFPAAVTSMFNQACRCQRSLAGQTRPLGFFGSRDELESKHERAHRAEAEATLGPRGRKSNIEEARARAAFHPRAVGAHGVGANSPSRPRRKSSGACLARAGLCSGRRHGSVSRAARAPAPITSRPRPQRLWAAADNCSGRRPAALDAVDVETVAHPRGAARGQTLAASPILGEEQAERAAALVTERTLAPVLASLASWRSWESALPKPPRVASMALATVLSLTSSACAIARSLIPSSRRCAALSRDPQIRGC